MPDRHPPALPVIPLESAPLAYENPTFLNSPDGRLIRIMAEYAEPLARFRRERIRDTVVFFGSARFRALDIAHQELEVLARPGQPSQRRQKSSRPMALRSTRDRRTVANCVAPRQPSRWRITTRTRARLLQSSRSGR